MEWFGSLRAARNRQVEAGRPARQVLLDPVFLINFNELNIIAPSDYSRDMGDSS